MSWIFIQQETFTNWVNSHISKAGMKCADLMKDLSNGLQVIALLEELSGKSLGKFNKNPRVPFQKLENLSICMKFCEQEGIKLVNISNEDIANGDQKLILGFIWTLFQHYSLQQGKTVLLSWLQNKIPKYNITNFTTDWADGRALCGLVNSIEPHLNLVPDHDSKDPKQGPANANLAIQIALDYFGIPKLISGKNMCAKSQDDKSIMMYLSAFPNAKLLPQKPADPSPATAAAPMVADTNSAQRAVPEPTTAHSTQVSAPVKTAEPHQSTPAAAPVKAATIPVQQPAPEIAKPKINYAAQSMAHGPGLQQGVKGKIAKFQVETPNKPDQGAVVIKISGTAAPPATVKDAGKGIHQVEYTPTQKGDLAIEVLVGDDQVPGSPFSVQVLAEISLGGEGKIRGFYSTTHGFAKDRKDQQALELLLSGKKVHLRKDFEPWVPIDIMDPIDRDAVFEKAGTKKLPIIYVDDKFIGGWDEIQALEEAGKLDDILRMDLYNGSIKTTAV